MCIYVCMWLFVLGAGCGVHRGCVQGLSGWILPLDAFGMPEEQDLFAQLAVFNESFHHFPAGNR